MFYLHDGGVGGCEGALILTIELTQAAHTDSISLDLSISSCQSSKQGRWGAARWVQRPHTERDLVSSLQGSRVQGQCKSDRGSFLRGRVVAILKS